MRIPWAWRSGPGQRGPESPADPPARGSGDPQHPEGASRQSQPRGFRRTERRCKLVGGGRAARTSAARQRSGLGRATEAPPTTPGGHPGKPHPGGSKGPSGIANGRVAGCASGVHRARARAWAARRRRTLPPRRGVPDRPTPGVPKHREALQMGGGRDARPVGMALGTCAEGPRVPGQPAAAHARARQTGARMVRRRAGKLGAGPKRCGGAARNVRRAPAGGARPCD